MSHIRKPPTQNDCVEQKPVSKARPSEQKVHFLKFWLQS